MLCRLKIPSSLIRNNNYKLFNDKKYIHTSLIINKKEQKIMKNEIKTIQQYHINNEIKTIEQYHKNEDIIIKLNKNFLKCLTLASATYIFLYNPDVFTGITFAGLIDIIALPRIMFSNRESLIVDYIAQHGEITIFQQYISIWGLLFFYHYLTKLKN
jgi:hypothetical protein